MRRISLLCVTVILSTMFVCAALGQEPVVQKPCAHTVVGDLQIVPFASKIFQNTRMLRVWLPPGYSDEASQGRRYPVLYMLDGQNLFDACTAFNGKDEWRIDETLTRLIAEDKVPPMIVVGIDNGGAQRAYEYLPYADKLQNPSMPEPDGKMFPDFLGKEIIPYVEAHYRTQPGVMNRALGGSSYGGVATLYTLITRPDLFQLGIVESPILSVGNAQLLRDTSVLAEGPAKVFLGFGGRESENPAIEDGMIKLVRMLETNLHNIATRPADVMMVIDPTGHHNEQAWAKRFPEAIQFLFGERQ